MKLLSAVGLVVLVCLGWSSARGASYDQRQKTITGKVVESGSSNAIANLTVKLTPPKASARSQKLTTTNRRGEFRFHHVEPGRYLLEVSQGLNVVYRKVFDTSHSDKKPIVLTPKSAERRAPPSNR